MSASPTSAAAVPSTKRPLEDPSSPSAPTDQPDAKRPALDKIIKEDGSEEPVTGQDSSDDTLKHGSVEAEKVKTEDLPVTNGSADLHGDTVVSDAPNGTTQSAAPATLPAAQPAQAVASSHDDRATSQQPTGPPQDETNWIHVRAVISSAEAATCIGKGGENVSQIRKLSNAKCTVSDYSRGAVERILTVSGQQDAVAKVSYRSKLFIQFANTHIRLSVSSFEL